MSSLLEKLELKKSEERATEALREENAQKEKAEAEKKVKISELYSRIEKTKEQKRAIDEAADALEKGYSAASSDLETLKGKKAGVEESKKEFESADQLIKTIIKDYREVLEESGIHNEDELLDSPEHAEDDEVKELKEAEASLNESRDAKTKASSSLRKSVGGLREAKKKLGETAPDLDLSFHKEERAASIEKLRRLSKTLNDEVERLEIETPEGQEKIDEKFASIFARRFEGKSFLAKRSPESLDGLVQAEDLKDGEKYGRKFIEGSIQEQADLRLKSEIEQQKEKTGITAAKQALEELKNFPKIYEELLDKAQALTQKRESVIRALDEQEKSGRSSLRHEIENYFRKKDDYNDAIFGKMLKDGDLARIVLFDREKNIAFKDYYGGLFDRNYSSNGYQNEQDARYGISGIISGFLEKKGDVVNNLRVSIINSGKSMPIESLFDPKELEHFMQDYDRFLDTYAAIVQDSPRTIMQEGGDSDVLYNEFTSKFRRGSESGKKTPFQPIEIKDQTVATELKSGKSFPEISEGIAASEKKLDETYSEAKERLDHNIDEEWAKREVEAFERAHPEAKGLQDKVETINREKIGARRIAVLLEQADKTFLPEDSYSKFSIKISSDGQGYFLSGISHPDLEKSKKDSEEAEQELRTISNMIYKNKETKRPLISFGKAKLDKELESLENDRAEKAKKDETARADYQSLIKSRDNVSKIFNSILYTISGISAGEEYGRSVSGDFSIKELIKAIGKINGDILSKSIPKEDAATLEQYKKLKH